MTARSPRATVVGVGNEYRRDDGIGPALITHLTGCVPDDVVLAVCDGEPSQLLEVWSQAELSVVVDAVLTESPEPGRIHRTTLPGDPDGHSHGAGGTHGLGIPDAVALAEALGRAPGRLVVLAVEAGDLGLGLGLTSEVAAVLPELGRRVLAELGRR